MKNAFSTSPGRQPVDRSVSVRTSMAPPAVSTADQGCQRLLQVCGLACALGVLGAGVAWLLQGAVGGATNLFFYGRLSLAAVVLADHPLGLLVVCIPPLGGVLVGLLAWYGSPALLGHALPETMEAILVGRSRIPLRLALLRPLATIVALGSGAPLGLDGPILQTGGAVGSLLGQWLRVTVAERKVLLAAGAAAGIAATFAAPVAAVLLAIELLLFEFRPRSLLPVALASAVAAGLRGLVVGSAPLLPVLDLPAVGAGQLPLFAVLGLCAGLMAVFLCRVVGVLEKAFERLTLHPTWWPALAGTVVGLLGLVFPQLLGVGVEQTQLVVAGQATLGFLVALLLGKALAWSLALAAGTPGGVLGPLLLLGGTLGGLLAHLVSAWLPEAAHPGLWAVACMAAVCASALRAPLMALVLALELTHRSEVLLPVLIACTVSELVSLALMRRHALLTDKLARRGVPVGQEYVLDALAVHTVGQVMNTEVKRVPASLPLGQLVALFTDRARGSRPSGYPVVDEAGRLVGFVTRSDVPDFSLRHHLDWLLVADVMTGPPLIVAWPDEPLRDAAERLLAAGVGQLPVVLPEDPDRVVGLLAQGDVLKVLAQRAEEEHPRKRGRSNLWVHEAA